MPSRRPTLRLMTNCVVVDPRTPVIVGRAQIANGTPDVDHPADAIDLMTRATIDALGDAGVAPSAVETVGVVGGIHRHRNAAAAVAHEIGCPTAHTIVTTWGGDTPVAFLGELGQRIVAGEIDVAVFVGGEANRTRDALRTAGREVTTRDDSEMEDPEQWGTPLEMGRSDAVERGGELPRNTYAIFDSALRAGAGESLDEARDRAAELWAGYSAVAASNPDIDVRSMDAAAIRTPAADNRMVSWPYTKAMCANNRVDQAGALVVCSSAAADRLGVAHDRRVYLHDTIRASDSDSFLLRERIDTVPGLDAAAALVVERWGPIDAIDHVDLYGCFPSIVRYTASALGLSPKRPLTVTGGLGFMGAPLNFAAGQSLIAMVRTLRAEPGTFGLVQGNGGHAAKHSFGVYSTAPPQSLPSVTVLDRAETATSMAAPDSSGKATIEGITVEYGHQGAERAVAALRLDGGGRLWANSVDPDVLDAAISRELVGVVSSVRAGEFRL